MSDQSQVESLPSPTGDEFTIREGVVVGRLTVRDLIGKKSHGAVVWDCVCECGEIVLRNAHTLKAALKSGTQSMCRTCRTEHFKEIRPWVKGAEWRRHARLRDLWENAGTLYGDNYDNYELHYLREESDLSDPVDLPIEPYSPDVDYVSPWVPQMEDDDGQTLLEIGEVFGCSRENIRLIEVVALRKLQLKLLQLDANAESKMKQDYLRRHGFIPPPKRRKSLQELYPVKKETPVETEKKGALRDFDKASLSVPEGCLLTNDAASALGWPGHTFRNRTAKERPAGSVTGPLGRPWYYWSQEQLEVLHAKYQGAPIPSPRKRAKKAPVAPLRRPVRVVEALPPSPPEGESHPCLLVVKTKVSGISMTIPVFVLQMARASDGNHQVKVKFPGTGSVKDSILDHNIIVWAKDLLTMDYSPFKTPWDD